MVSTRGGLLKLDYFLLLSFVTKQWSLITIFCDQLVMFAEYLVIECLATKFSAVAGKLGANPPANFCNFFHYSVTNLFAR